MQKEDLGGSRFVYTDTDCTFGTDALLLGQFTAVTSRDRVCDLGSGCGILPLLFSRLSPAPTVDAVELYPDAAALLRQTVCDNHLTDTITVYEEDWRSLSLPVGVYDIVVCNPPYFPEHSGSAAATPARRLARQEQGDTLTQISSAAMRLLKHGGHFCLCHRPERLADVFAALRAHGLEPKRLQLVHTRADLPPFLLLCDAVRGAKPSLSVLPPLVLESR